MGITHSHGTIFTIEEIIIPGTMQGLAILILAALPGLIYLGVRERFLGMRPQELEISSRLLRAVIVSVVLDCLYLTAIGPGLIKCFRGGESGLIAVVSKQSRVFGLTALVLIVAIPGSLAWIEVNYLHRRRNTRENLAPTAWDALFQRRGPCFVRARLKGGGWIGGWYGSTSSASAYPQPADIFLQSQWAMASDGGFSNRVQQSAGVYFRMDDVEFLEVLDDPEAREVEESNGG